MATFTLAQAHQRFKILYDKVDSFNSPEFTPEEIDEFLNIGQDTLLALITAKGIEQTQELTDMLKNLTVRAKTTTFITSSLNLPNSVFVQLPFDYYTALREEALVTYTKCGNSVSELVGVVPVTRDRYNKIKDDPFNKPDPTTILRLAHNNTLNNTATGLVTTFELISSPSVIITEYIIDYIKRPNYIQYGTQYASPSVDVNCELEDKAYYKIIELAVDKALEAMRLKSPQQNKN